MSRFVLGIDAGGTSTTAAILNESGVLLGVGSGGPGNLDDIGSQAVARHLADAVAAARRSAGIGNVRFASAFVGLAGVISANDRETARAMVEPLGLAPDNCLRIDHDCRVALAGALSGRPGIVLIAGTGSASYGRTADGRSWRAGGWGSLVGDEGSGYWLGVQALRAVARAADGRGSTTQLVDTIATALEISSLDNLLHRIHIMGTSRREIAALAPLVVTAATRGDRIACGMLEEAANELAIAVVAVARRLDLDSPEIGVVGGLFRSGETALAPLRQCLERELPASRLRLAERSPAVGAAHLALDAIDAVGHSERS